MSINLEDYAELLEDLSPHSQEGLHATWHEATKVFSPRGLDNYLKGAAAIRGPRARATRWSRPGSSRRRWWPRKSARMWWPTWSPPR